MTTVQWTSPRIDASESSSHCGQAAPKRSGSKTCGSHILSQNRYLFGDGVLVLHLSSLAGFLSSNFRVCFSSGVLLPIHAKHFSFSLMLLLNTLWNTFTALYLNSRSKSLSSSVRSFSGFFRGPTLLFLSLDALLLLRACSPVVSAPPMFLKLLVRELSWHRFLVLAGCFDLETQVSSSTKAVASWARVAGRGRAPRNPPAMLKKSVFAGRRMLLAGSRLLGVKEIGQHVSANLSRPLFFSFVFEKSQR